MKLESKLRPDVRSVLQAAALLDVTEFDLFRLAWARWHGSEADDATLEPFFVAYMFADRVPPWVRHFARLVEDLYRAGRLDRGELGVKRLPGSQQMVNRGLRYGVAAFVVLTSLIVLAEFAAQVLELGEKCMFPPCY